MDISTVLIGLAALIALFLLRKWIDVYVFLPIQARVEMRRLNEDIKRGKRRAARSERKRIEQAQKEAKEEQRLSKGPFYIQAPPDYNGEGSQRNNNMNGRKKR